MIKAGKQNGQAFHKKKEPDMNIERKFGVEIEVLTDGLSQEKIASAIRDAGVQAFAEGYNHSTKTHWKVITDASAGFEVVSPVLGGEDGFNQVEKVCKALTLIGAKVDKKCGLHVHVDARDMSRKEIASVTAAYGRWEKMFDAIVPESRRGNANRYCRSVSEFMRVARQGKSKVVTDVIEMFERPWDYDANDMRYHKVNLCAYGRHGTIEFRQHSGTTEADKVLNWVVLMLSLVDTAKGKYLNLKDVKVSLVAFKKYLGISKHHRQPRIAQCSRWLDARFAYFNAGVSFTAVL
jgi:hypothetical protein